MDLEDLLTGLNFGGRGPLFDQEETETTGAEEPDDFFSPHPSHMMQNRMTSIPGSYNETPRVDTPAYQAQGYEGATGEVAPVDSAGNDPRSAFERYSSWSQRKPKREDYRVGTMDAIAAGLSAFTGGFTGNPIGMKTADMILDGRFNNAMADWEDEGKALKDVGTLGSVYNTAGAKVQGDIMDYNARMAKNKTDMEKNAADIADSKRRHEAAMKKIEVEGGNTQNKNAEIVRHNKELEGLLRQQNALKGEANAIDRIQANAYSRGVDAKARGVGASRGSYRDKRSAMGDSIREMLVDPQYAALKDAFITDKEGGLARNPDYEPKSEQDLQVLRTLLMKAEAMAQKKLEAVGPLHGSEDIDLPPVRQMAR